MATASLIIYGKTPTGWRRGNIVYGKNGLPKPGVMLVSKAEVSVNSVTYQIRTYVERAAQYVAVGTDYREAKALLERMQLTRERETLDAKLGIASPKTPKELAAEESERLAEAATIEADRLAEIAVKEADRLAEVQRSRKTLLAAEKTFLDRKAKLGLSRHSTELYKTIGAFIRYTGKVYLDELTESDVSGFYDSLRAEYAQRTRQNWYMTLRGWLKASGVNLADLIDEASHRRLRAKPAPATEPYTHEQTERLLAVCDDYYRLVFTLLLSTGLRMQEAMNLTWAQVKWEDNQIVVRGEQAIHHKSKRILKFKTKTGAGRKVPLFPTLRVMLEAHRVANPDTTFVLGTRTDLPNGHWLEYLKRFARKAGLNCGQCAGCVSKTKNCEGFFLHKFRHTYAVRCLNKFSIHQVSKWMGHQDLSVTSIYLSGTPKDADCDPFAKAA